MSARKTSSRAAYQAYRSAQIRRGTWAPYVDAEPVRAHVRALLDTGLSCNRISQLAGVHCDTVLHLLTAPRGRRATQQVRRTTVAALLAVSAVPPPARYADAAATHRRLRALVALGWPQTRLSAELGFARIWVGRALTQDRVSHRAEAAVAALYERLRDAAPEDHGVPAGIATRTRNNAAYYGWDGPARNALPAPEVQPT